ncbi:MAG: class I SAM-dependent methyltransferase, partial [Planctomycetes bacterium]|nr:class I SAM-dependent methyltransferase [Planctomycetota bacterium]
PHIRRCGYRRICEIGAQRGANTDLLLRLPDVEITLIDPCRDADLLLQYADEPRVSVAVGRSLDVLPVIEAEFDCILIDGDHNWYTVSNELHWIERRHLLTNPGTVFLHDVGWPYGRRDLYYAPSDIPPNARQPWARGGVVRGSDALHPSGLNADLAHATHEGGPRNGVLTAVEDFLEESASRYTFSVDPREFGLGVLLNGRSADHRWITCSVRLRSLWERTRARTGFGRNSGSHPER